MNLFEEHGYFDLKQIKMPNGKEVWAGLFRFIYTVGLVIDIDETGYRGRYCFHSLAEAREVLRDLTQLPEDLIIPGNWIKHKGFPREIRNPNYVEHEVEK